MGVNIMQQGIVKSDLFSEIITNPFDPNVYIEPDGSAWIRVFHHGDPASVRFTSTDTFTTQVYKDTDRWFNVSLCNRLSGSWELMIKQLPESNGTLSKYRWVQSYNPMTATFAQVASANITKNTTTGYSSFSHGGLYPINSVATYLCTNTGNQGSWFGAVGAWNTHQGGIPGWAGVVVKTGYMDLYVRIDNVTFSSNQQCSFGQDYIIANELIEI